MSMLVNNVLLHLPAQPWDGIWRVVCCVPACGDVVLAKTPFVPGQEPDSAMANPRNMKLRLGRIGFDEFAAMEEAKTVLPVEMEVDEYYNRTPEQLSPAALARFTFAKSVMRDFLTTPSLISHFTCHNDFGLLIQRAAVEGKYVRKNTKYQWLKLLIAHGFAESSLYPRLHRRGAPGLHRPWGVELDAKSKKMRSRPGARCIAEKLGVGEAKIRGITPSERRVIVSTFKTFSRPGVSFSRIYVEVAGELWGTATHYKNGEWHTEMPEVGTYPTIEQVKHLVRTDLSLTEKILRRTTSGHWQRNLRPLKGRAIDGVPGPGHTYAIDSTVGDLHLRASFDPNWLVGRPLVYFLVDFWSFAIVSVYVCLRTPNWQSAACAVFQVGFGGENMRLATGLEAGNALRPAPTLPGRLLCDRGEYLSQGASVAAQRLSFVAEYNPAYRPDLKGQVELVHRLAKDQQYGIVPGAIDARRRELELRPDARKSRFTVFDAFQYFLLTADMMNRTRDMSHRCPAEMIAAGYPQTPAGMWAWGHDIGIGYRSTESEVKIIKSLVPQVTARVTKSGLQLGSLSYVGDWGGDGPHAHVRSSGTFEVPAFQLPSTIGAVWAEIPGVPFQQYTLAPNERIGPYGACSEWEDIQVFNSLTKRERQHQALEHKVDHLAETRRIIEVAENRVANAIPSSDVPKVREARGIENDHLSGRNNPDKNTGVKPEAEISDPRDELIINLISKGAG